MPSNKEKAALREMGLSIRRMADTDHDHFARVLAHAFNAQIGFDDLGMLAFYWPMLGEADGRIIARHYFQNGGRICLPTTDPYKKEIRFFEWDFKTPLVTGGYGILEPNQEKQNEVIPDTIITPLVLFDGHGNRIGYGGGHYDATYAAIRAKHKVKAIGLAYDDQFHEASWTIHPYDQRLDIVLTPTKIYHFSDK